MRVIVIGAGRGRRLMPTTADAPKCFAEVAGKRLIDWAVDAFDKNGLSDICFIGGYRIDKVQEAFPRFTFRENRDWENNNILASLFCAEDLMDDGFICCYSDILFTPDVVGRLATTQDDMAVGVDTEWLTRYEGRTDHPPDDAEKASSAGGSVSRIHRQMPEHEATTANTSASPSSRRRVPPASASITIGHGAKYTGRPWREAAIFEKAYLILLFQEMIERGERFAHVDTPGGYIEVDTQQDFEYARQHWLTRHQGK